MADVNANIGVNIDASQALAELKNLQRQISQFHTSIARSSATAAAAQRNLQTDFLNSINATGKFAAEMRTIKTASESFTSSLEKNKFSMGEYFKYAGGASRTFGRLFKTEFDTIQKVAEDRVKKLQTQYIKMGRDANGALKAIAVTPLALDMDNLQTKTMIAAQKQQLFNELVAKGTTNLINFGKNTQWAGRQLMVGFTIPLSIFGSKASQAFLEMEQQALRFKRVYGDLFTSTPEINANLEAVRGLAQEYLKYGVAVKDTMSLAADAAAAGMQGAKLQETVRQATKLSVLGEVDKQQAFQATISLQTAFNMSNQQLAESVDFLNAVENQSVTSLQDMTDAIPKVAPVIRGLGGDVKDMAVFLTAMKEGGVDAAEAANGLKSALASMINPTKAAKEMLAGVGIDLQAITERNKGNLMRTVLELGDALKGLEPLSRTRILEKLFGKYQFARVSALFDNISKSGSQAQRTMELMSMSASDLARISNKELTQIEENATTKFKAAVEGLKTAIAPVGEVFLQVVTPVLNVIAKLADKFSGLSDHTKRVIAIILTVIGGIAPVVLMLVGLFANFFGQIMKFFSLIRNGYTSLTGGSKVLGEQTKYLTTAQIEAEAVAASLDQVHAKLTQRFTSEAAAVNLLRTAYLNAAAASEAFTLANPNMMMPGFKGPKRKYADGVVMVPGTGSGDKVPAMLEPGESVIPKAMTKKYGALINGMIADNIPGYKGGKGTTVGTVLGGTFAGRSYSPIAMMAPGNAPGGFGMDKEWLKFNEEAKASFGSALKTVMMLEGDIKATQSNYAKFSEGLNPILDDIFGIFKEGITDDVTNISQVGQSQYPKIVKHIQDLEKSSAITAEKSQQLQNAARKLMAPTQEDLTQQNIQRVELAQNEQGQAYVKRASTERFGKSYKAQAKANFLKELKYRNMQAPEDYKTKYQFAHIPESPKFMKFIPPFFRKKSGSGTALEQQVAGMLASGQILKEGDIINTSGKVVDAAKLAVQQKQQSKSPSKVAKQLAFDFGAGYREGLVESLPAIAEEGAAMANAAAGGASGGGGGPTGGGVAGGSTGGSGRFGKRVGGLVGKVKAMGPLGPARMMMGASGAVMAASMMPGPVGDFAQKLMPATMGLQALATALPLLTNPIGATVAAFAGLAFLIHKANKAYEAHVKAIQDSAKAEVSRKYGGVDAAQGYAKFTGQGLPSSQQFNRVGAVRYISADEAKIQGFKEFYGQKGNIATKAITGAKPENKVSAIATDVANRAALFGLSPKDIAANIKAASDLVGANEFDVKAKVQQLLAPGGKDILKEPLDINTRINFLKSSTDKQLADLQTRIGKLGKNTLQPYTGGYAGAAAYAAQQQKAQDKQIRDTAVASELLKKSFFDQTQALALLNQAYVDGTITKEEYNKQFEVLNGNMEAVGKSTLDLVAKMDILDKSGKTSKALLSDMADSVLGQFKDLGKETTKIVKKTLGALPPEVQTNIMIGLAAGSLQPTDIIIMSDLLEKMKGKTIKQQYEILNASKNGLMQPVIDQITLTILAQQKLDKVMEISKAKQDGASGAALRGLQKQLDSINAQIDATEKRIKEGTKVDPAKTDKNGNKVVTDTSTKTNPFADAMKQITGQTRAMQEQVKAYNLLKKAKYSDRDASQLAADSNIAEALSMKLSTDQRKKLMAALKAYNAERKKSAVFNAKRDLDNQITALKEEANALDVIQKHGVDADTALEMMGNETFKTLILATIQAGGDIDALIAKIQKALGLMAKMSGGTAQTQADKDYAAYNKAYDAAMQYFEAQAAAIEASRQAGEDAIQAEIDKKQKAIEQDDIDIQKVQDKIDVQQGYIDELNHENDVLQHGIDIENAKLKPIQDQIDAKQKLIDQMNHENDLTQHAIDLNNEQISAYQHQIELLQHQSDINYGKPLKALQDESDLLSHDLSLIDHQAEAINKYYDEQQAALEQVNKLNQDAIQQGKQKISIADALSQGDIAAAAQQVQDLRAQEAATNATSMQSALDVSRKSAIEGITVNGKTKADIEQRTWDIQQQEWTLQQQQKVIEEQIAAIKEQIYPLEQANYDLQLKIQANKDAQWAIEQEIFNLNASMQPIKDNIAKLEKQIEDNKAKQWQYEAEIYRLQTEELKPLEEQRKKDEQALKDAQDKLDKYKAHTKELIDQIDYKTRLKKAWEDEKIAVDAAYQEIKKATASTQAAAAAAESLLGSYQSLAAMPEIHTYVTNHITNIIETIYTSSGSPGGSVSGSVTPIPNAQDQSQPDLSKVLVGFGGRISRYAGGGSVVPGEGLLDKVNALLTPGEFVVNKSATKAYLPLLEAINNQIFPTMNIGKNAFLNKDSIASIQIDAKQFSNSPSRVGPISSNLQVSKNEISTDNSSAVYNYNVDININGNNMDAETVANTVLVKIKQLQDQQIRRRLQS